MRCGNPGVCLVAVAGNTCYYRTCGSMVLLCLNSCSGRGRDNEKSMYLWVLGWCSRASSLRTPVRLRCCVCLVRGTYYDSCGYEYPTADSYARAIADSGERVGGVWRGRGVPTL